MMTHTAPVNFTVTDVFLYCGNTLLLLPIETATIIQKKNW